ncbi:MAG TPA: DUF6600 domain-containing protein [Kofleriaceae bacterium]|nr:DUF6600 domain-containing protein [Kofleriaceae bacterium]
MRKLPLIGLVAWLVPSCYSQYDNASTLPAPAPQPTTVYGPPGGNADPGYGYEAPGQPGYPAGYEPGASAGYPDGYPPGTEYGVQDDQAAAPAPATEDPYGASADVQPTAPVTDVEIDTTLQPYGEWVEDPEYGRVWRPYATVVGVNFTPYETCGSWVYTEYGWTFACDWDWGWLPFHYGNWVWLDAGFWGWCPGYEWSPAWVDWRYGGGYVGWRPSGPRIRDHRRHHNGPIVRDHRHNDSHWRFTTVSDFGKHNIRAHTGTNLADALDKTQVVTKPPVRNTTPITVRARDTMRGRIGGGLAQDPTRGLGGARPVRGNDRGPWGVPQTPSRGASVYQPPASTYQPPRGSTYQPPASTYQPPRGSTYQPPASTYQPPSRGSTYQPPTYQPPSRPTYQPPTSYTPPSRGTYQPPTYTPPSRGTYTPPVRSSYTPPSRSTYSPPSRSSYSPPSRSSSSYTPSRSSSSSSSSSSSRSSSSSSHSSSSSSHSSGHSGGGRHR